MAALPEESLLPLPLPRRRRWVEQAVQMVRRAHHQLAWGLCQLRTRRMERAHARAGETVTAHGLTISVDHWLIRDYEKVSIRDGIYEADEIELLKKHLDPSLPAVELGGSIGVVACLTNRMLKKRKRHVVVEANPLVIPTLRKNRLLNGCRFEILHAAVAYDGPSVDFVVGEDSLTGGLKRSGSEKHRVPTVTLREIVALWGFGAINLIVDVEGAEVEMIAHELDVIREHVKLLLMETHERLLADGSTPRMIASLENAGFRILGDDRDACVLVFFNDALARSASTP